MILKIATREGVQEVEAQPILIRGIQCFQHIDAEDGFVVSHFASGMRIACDRNLTAATEMATEKLSRIGVESDIIRFARTELQQNNITYPVNSLTKK